MSQKPDWSNTHAPSKCLPESSAKTSKTLSKPTSNRQINAHKTGEELKINPITDRLIKTSKTKTLKVTAEQRQAKQQRRARLLRDVLQDQLVVSLGAFDGTLAEPGLDRV